MSCKLKRTPNFTESERCNLIKITNLYRSVIECKKTDAVTWKDKEEAWKKVEIKFNSMSSGPARTAKQLKNKYEAVKKTMKKDYSQHMRYVRGTGGGAYVAPPTPETEEEKILAETIALSVKGLQNRFDSDGVAGGETGISVGRDMNDNERELELYNEITENSNEENVEIEENLSTMEIENDWTPPNTGMLQTSVHGILRPSTSHNIQVLATNDTPADDHNVIEAGTSEIENVKQKWHSRRRPVIPKRKTVSSAGAKFETLAEQKVELIALEKQIAQEKLNQIKNEHVEKMKVLALQREKEELGIELIKYQISLAKSNLRE